MTLALTASRSALLPLVARTLKVVERRNTIPILGHLVLTAAADGTVEIMATDLDIWCRETLPAARARAEVASAGRVALPAQLFHDVLRKLPDGAVRLTLDKAGARATLSAGRARFAMNGLPPEDFPDLPAVEAPSFDIAPATLTEIAAAVGFAISTEETRYYLNGIFLHRAEPASHPHPEVPSLSRGEGSEGGQTLTAVATDGHRLSRLDLAPPDDLPDFPGVIIPRKTVGLFGLLAESAGEAPVSLAITEQKIRFCAGDLTIVSKLIDGTFPDYGRVIPQTAPLSATFDREALAAAVDRVATVSSERGRGVKWTLTPGELQLTMESADTGTGDETLPAGTEGEPSTCILEGGFSIGFNARYLADLLGSLAGPEVVFRLTDPSAPALVSDPADPRRTLVLMPMRV
ncbi:DNA polymerase III subunit beta [Jiella marina]|uniref:DNA polymerase III subunit beta n=1 Tax=Jiella sp. LLJ827 TaxID=2917712 RepID=UPI002100CF64|nr:DNA polymerase III subunit beta [Jiella sp. LLJ827]MCQ0986435.1 DNA polymerase III subunit beta [Jiella sp. LLJ827]